MNKVLKAIKWLFYRTEPTYRASQYANWPELYAHYKSHEGDVEYKFRYGWYYVAITAVALATLVGIMAFIVTADRSACRDKAAIKGIDYEWSVWAGCVYPSEERDDETHTIEIV